MTEAILVTPAARMTKGRKGCEQSGGSATAS